MPSLAWRAGWCSAATLIFKETIIMFRFDLSAKPARLRTAVIALALVVAIVAASWSPFARYIEDAPLRAAQASFDESIGPGYCNSGRQRACLLRSCRVWTLSDGVTVSSMCVVDQDGITVGAVGVHYSVTQHKMTVRTRRGTRDGSASQPCRHIGSAPSLAGEDGSLGCCWAAIRSSCSAPTSPMDGDWISSWFQPKHI
jgi:hypothetical protein